MGGPLSATRQASPTTAHTIKGNYLYINSFWCSDGCFTYVLQNRGHTNDYSKWCRFFSLKLCCFFFELVGLAHSNLGSIDFIMDANLNYVIKLFIDMINTASLQFETCDLLGMQLLASIFSDSTLLNILHSIRRSHIVVWRVRWSCGQVEVPFLDCRSISLEQQRRENVIIPFCCAEW